MYDKRKYWTRCRLHDWFYMMSDDPDAYRDGDEEREELERLARMNPDLFPIYDAWRAHHYEAGAKPAEPLMEESK